MQVTFDNLPVAQLELKWLPSFYQGWVEHLSIHQCTLKEFIQQIKEIQTFAIATSLIRTENRFLIFFVVYFVLLLLFFFKLFFWRFIFVFLFRQSNLKW